MIERRLGIALGMAATVAATALWHGPLGAADRFAHTAEQTARRTLDYYEMAEVRAMLERGPLNRRLILSGPADDFQRGELVRIMSDIPGIGSARWAAGSPVVPMLAEAALLSLIAFGLGLLLAYLAEIRRRANAQWRW